MGVQYYLFVPSVNVVYDVGKWRNFLNFEGYFKSKYRNLDYYLFSEHEYDFDAEEDQKVTLKIECDYGKFTIELTVPADVKRVDCFSADFLNEFNKWKAKVERWKAQDKEFANLPDREKGRIIEESVKAILEDEEQ